MVAVSASIIIEAPNATAPPLESPVPAVTVREELARSELETEPSTIMVLSMPLILNSVPAKESPVPAVYVVSVAAVVWVVPSAARTV